MTLGRDKITDWSGGGEAGNIHYTDYKKAYTDGSTLIDINNVSMEGRAGSMDSIKHQRSGISYSMSEQDRTREREREILGEHEEKKRQQRVSMYDQKHADAYERIHGLLLK